MKISHIVAGVALAMGTTGVLAQDADRTDWPESFTVGTASQGGTYFAYGSGWANLVADELGISGGGEVTGGPMQNMALVHTGDAAFGMTTMGPAAESIEGTNPIAPGLQMTNACAIFPMYQTPFSVTALTSSGITTIADIPAGAKIGFGLEVQTDVNIIEFTEEEQATILGAFPVAEFAIGAGTYSSLEADARSVSMWNFAIANCELPASFVEAAVDVVMSDNARMVGIHKAAGSTLPENYVKNDVMMWHPGAAKWFRENAGADISDDQVFGM